VQSIFVVFGQFGYLLWNYLPSFWIFPIVCKHTEMACCQAVLQAPFQFAQSLYPAVLTAVRFNLSRASRTRFIFKTEISLVKFLIPSFTCSMTYSVLSSTNHCFSSIFLQMKREMDGKSNMSFCYYHCEHYWFLRLCASNAIWHFRRPNVNALKPQKGGKIYKI